MQKRALITGITGQDGSYLAELLLEQGYEVIGMIRRTSTVNFERIKHIQDRLTLVTGDLLDEVSMMSILREYRPSEVYNLAAQSFVQTSWGQPVFTGEATALGVTRILDAVRMVDPEIRFYQASSSEMFGKVREVPQSEDTPFYPRSPYGVAKVYGHWITVNYRESYNMFACSGILFNHECVTAETPVIVRRNGLIDILPIEDVVPHTSPDQAMKWTTEPAPDNPIEVWDRAGWVRVTCMTATWNGHTHNPNKAVRRIAAPGAFYQATDDHVIFAEYNGDTIEKPAGQVRTGDNLALIALPEPTNIVMMSEDEAWLLGVLAAIGEAHDDGYLHMNSHDQKLLDRVTAYWQKIAGSTACCEEDPTQLWLPAASGYGHYLRETLYTQQHQKRIPRRVLNASQAAHAAFLGGFGEGTDSTRITYTDALPGFTTTSAPLAAGLYWLMMTTLQEEVTICPDKYEDQLYYHIHLKSSNASDQPTKYAERSLAEVVGVEELPYRGWLFDLATESGTFHAGIGQGWIHNSPRRGLEFVTRKITDGVARIKLGLAEELRLGNLDAQRDWGYAPDYVHAMWLMLQQATPEDYVVATGETHSVREFVQLAFESVNLDYRDFVVQDERFMRPAEVDLLVGDPTRARELLGWQPTVAFPELVRIMVEADLKVLKEQNG